MATDYNTKIDPETWAYIQKYWDFYPSDSIALPIQEQRKLYETMVLSFRPELPIQIERSDQIVPGTPPVAIRRYTGGSGGATILFMHGGGFALGNLDSHDPICADLCGRTGYDVIAVEYRLAPEHLHPAQYEDCSTVYDWLYPQLAHPLILFGDSAGGSLAASLAHTKRDAGCPAAAQVLVYPGLGGDRSARSYGEHADAPLLNRADVDYWRNIRLGDQTAPDNTRYRALCDQDYHNLPATVIVTAECDPLTSDSETYQAAITAAGGRAVWLDQKGLVHGFLHGRHEGRRLATAFDQIVIAIKALGADDWRQVLDLRGS